MTDPQVRSRQAAGPTRSAADRWRTVGRQMAERYWDNHDAYTDAGLDPTQARKRLVAESWPALGAHPRAAIRDGWRAYEQETNRE